jgi:Arc/MetJ-type ribon-helix-helix transcriptional regulator
VKQTTMRLPIELLERAKRLCSARHKSVSSVIRNALERELRILESEETTRRPTPTSQPRTTRPPARAYEPRRRGDPFDF